MTDAEMKDRQEFAFEAAVRMRDRFMQQEVWERMGVNVSEIVPLVLADPTRGLFQTMLFSKIVPNCKKLGLLDRNDKWLRHRFEEMGVIQFEDWADTGEEYVGVRPRQRGDAGRPRADLILDSGDAIQVTYKSCRPTGTPPNTNASPTSGPDPSSICCRSSNRRRSTGPSIWAAARVH